MSKESLFCRRESNAVVTNLKTFHGRDRIIQFLLGFSFNDNSYLAFFLILAFNGFDSVYNNLDNSGVYSRGPRFYVFNCPLDINVYSCSIRLIHMQNFTTKGTCGAIPNFNDRIII